MKKWIIAGLFSIVVAITGCTNEQGAAPVNKENIQTTATGEGGEQTTSLTSGDSSDTTAVSSEVQETSVPSSSKVPEGLKKPLKVGLVSRLTSGSFFASYNKGVQAQVKAFGGELKVYDSNNDLAKMASNIETAVNEKVDVLLVNNGTAQALEPVVQKAVNAGISVVAYDTDLTMEGVTTINQDDYMLAWQSLKKLAGDLNGEGEIAVIWVAGYLPMERRGVMMDAFFKRYPEIKEISRFGTASANTSLDTQAQVEALLKKYPKEGDVDAIFSNWNEFTRGALKALEQSGRTDIKLYGIDLTEEELPLFQNPNSPWVAAAATNPTDVGAIQARLAYQKAAGETVADDVSIEPYLIEKTALPEQTIPFSDLGKYVPGWGESKEARSPWMPALEAQGAGK